MTVILAVSAVVDGTCTLTVTVTIWHSHLCFIDWNKFCKIMLVREEFLPHFCVVIVHSFISITSFIYSAIHSFIHFSISSFISFILPSISLSGQFIHSFIHQFNLWFHDSFTSINSFTHSFIHVPCPSQNGVFLIANLNHLIQSGWLASVILVLRVSVISCTNCLLVWTFLCFLITL